MGPVSIFFPSCSINQYTIGGPKIRNLIFFVATPDPKANVIWFATDIATTNLPSLFGSHMYFYFLFLGEGVTWDGSVNTTTHSVVISDAKDDCLLEQYWCVLPFDHVGVIFKFISHLVWTSISLA